MGKVINKIVFFFILCVRKFSRYGLSISTSVEAHLPLKRDKLKQDPLGKENSEILRILFVGPGIQKKEDVYLPGPSRVNHELVAFLQGKSNLDLHLHAIHIRNLNELLRALLTLRRVDCVHISGISGWSVPLALGAKINGKPLSMTIHGLLEIERRFRRVKFRSRIFEKLLLISADCIVSVSKSLAICLPSYLSKKIVIIPNGWCKPVESTFLCFHKRVPPRRTCLKVMTTGGTRPEKGVLFLLKALEQCSFREIKLIIFGESGSDYNQVMKYKGKVQIENRGWVPREELFLELRNVDLFIQASKYEPFGMAPLEALSMGTRTIVTRECGVADYLEPFFLKQPWAGAVVEYGDVKKLAATIDKIMTVKNDTVDLSLLQDLTWECIAQRYFKLWQELSQKAQLRVDQQ